jgi:hypothetical protein
VRGVQKENWTEKIRNVRKKEKKNRKVHKETMIAMKKKERKKQGEKIMANWGWRKGQK